MRFNSFLATRYLKGAQGRTGGGFLRFVSLVGVGGVAVGVAALLLALAVVRGFSGAIQEKIFGFGAHVQIATYEDAPLDSVSALVQQAEAQPEVVAATPLVQEFVLLRAGATEIDGVLLNGVEQLPPLLTDQLADGDAALDEAAGELPSIVIGQALATDLGLAIGDVVTAFSMRSEPVGAGLFPDARVRQFRIGGVFESLLENYDQVYVYAPIGAVRRLLEYEPDQASLVQITVSDLDAIEPVAARLDQVVGFPYFAQTIYQAQRPLFAWIDLQQQIIPLVISVIVLVAAFNIIGMLLMLILEKTREIGILASMGASRRRIRHVFAWLGLLIGLVGTAIGEVLALALILLQDRYALIPLPAEAYYLRAAPVELNVLDFVLVAVIAVVLCQLAAYVPARVAARVDPIRVIRFQ